MIKGAPFSFVSACLVIVVLSAIGFAWHYSATLSEKDATITRLEKSLEASDKDNGRLDRQVAQLRTYRASDFPLKKKALILAQQIRDFTRDWKDTDQMGPQMMNCQAYLKRFGTRASITRDDLDQVGLHSDKFDHAMYDFSCSYADIRTIASEIERLANAMPDIP